MIVLSPERMKRYDEYAINTWGIPSAVLMENAGRATYRLIKDAYLHDRKHLAIFCGKGNNGGDGFVIGRYALRNGYKLTLFLLGTPSDLKGDALLNYNLFTSLGGKVIALSGDDGINKVTDAMDSADVVVDAIFGTGLTKAVKGVEKTVIETINGSGKTIIAVDIPSGIDGLSGMPLGAAVRAHHTFTFGCVKTGLLLYPGAAHCGKVTLIDISLPRSAESILGMDGAVVDSDMLRGFYRHRLPDAHKGSFGNCIVVAGSMGKTGAAAMTTEGALRIGAGLVTLVVPSTLNTILEMKLTEAMTYPVEDGGLGFFPLSAFPTIRQFADDKDVVILGPGMGRRDETSELARKLFAELDKPFVVDADGINAFVGHLDLFKTKQQETIITPHPGEFGRLINKSAREVNDDRLTLGRQFAEEYGVTLVLKGAPTITFSSSGDAFFNPTGNPALAKGGTGDVLTGFIGGLLSQGYTALQAVLFGVYLHGSVADKWVAEYTDMDLVAGDLISGVGRAIRDIVDGTDRVYIERSL
jgi:ADP-dependent NAD(P)H-hydrate dehydratase / NAD(P)H-hydrate epimerase